MKPVLIRQHGETGPPGVLGDWLRDRRIPAVVHPAHLGVAPPNPEQFVFIASLGSANSPAETDKAEVAEELELLERAIEHDVPVLGLCFGGQALAVALGGSVERADRPELGWHEIDTDAPELVPPGPWLQWHYDRFVLPVQVEELARTATGSQAFRSGPHLGVQFHPESTIERVSVWARKDAARTAEHGVSDGVALLERGRANQDRAIAAAYALFDAFWERAREERGS